MGAIAARMACQTPVRLIARVMLPLLRRALQGAAAAQHAGAVDRATQRAEGGLGSADGGLELFRTAHVAVRETGAAAGRGDLPHRLLAARRIPMSATTTAHPSAASAAAQARPIPEPPPVTSAARLLWSISVSLLQRVSDLRRRGASTARPGGRAGGLRLPRRRLRLFKPVPTLIKRRHPCRPAYQPRSARLPDPVPVEPVE